jgi:hypothetical protein
MITLALVPLRSHDRVRFNLRSCFTMLTAYQKPRLSWNLAIKVATDRILANKGRFQGLLWSQRFQSLLCERPSLSCSHSCWPLCPMEPRTRPDQFKRMAKP